MIKNLIVSARARADIKGILYYTEKNWGLVQRKKYATLLDHALAVIAHNPDAKHQRTFGEFQYIRIQKHFIFYQRESGHVTIVRVLHARMDFSRHLS